MLPAMMIMAKKSLKTASPGAGKMAQEIRVFVAKPFILGLSPHTCWRGGNSGSVVLAIQDGLPVVLFS